LTIVVILQIDRAGSGPIPRLYVRRNMKQAFIVQRIIRKAADATGRKFARLY
jgi:hypothetical protein